MQLRIQWSKNSQSLTTISYYFTMLQLFCSEFCQQRRHSYELFNDLCQNSDRNTLEKKQPALSIESVNLMWGNLLWQTQNSKTEVILLYTIAIVYSLYTFQTQQIGWKDIFLLGKCERDTSGRYETPHWNLSIQPSNVLWIDFELILCDEHRTPKRKSCLLVQYRIYTLYTPVLYTDGL